MMKKAETQQIAFSVDLGCKGETCELDQRSMKGGLVNILEFAFESCRLDRLKNDHTVRFRLTSDKDNAVFHIEDNGIGLDRESQEKIFSLSFSAMEKEGSILGLFAANKVNPAAISAAIETTTTRARSRRTERRSSRSSSACRASSSVRSASRRPALASKNERSASVSSMAAVVRHSW